MRADGGSRNGKMEKTRLVGIGMMLAGILSITFAVAGVSGAGANAASPAHYQCQGGGQWSSTTGQLAGAIDKGCGSETTTTMHTKCTCSTTTTMAESTTTKPCNTTTTAGETTTTAGSTTTSMEVSGETTTTAGGTTTTAGETTTTAGGTTTTAGETTTTGATHNFRGTTTTSPSIVVQGVTSTLPGITVQPASGTLPFTGGSPFPLAAFGVVLLATGAGLSRRKRRIV